ncbi:MAG: hypothetical protein JSS81_15185 [Acidobacteria bacterium]|nr:hypothetical protein [Acidobacteriota bacterium]
MRNKNPLLPALIFALCLSAAVLADVPPPSDYERVRLDLIIRTTEDLSDYRFFLDFYGDLREIEVKNKGETVIPPSGGGARYSNAAFYAVPRAELAEFGSDAAPETLTKIQQAIVAKKIPGAVRLFNHQFISERPKGSTPLPQIYTITRSGKSLVSQFGEPLPKGPAGDPPPADAPSDSLTSKGKLGLAVGGGLAAVLFLGVAGWLLIRRKSLK